MAQRMDVGRVVGRSPRFFPSARYERIISDSTRHPSLHLLDAIVFGQLTSLLEVALMFLFKPLRDPSPGLFRLNRHALWMIPTFNLALFAAVGVLLAILASRLPKLAERIAPRLFLGLLSLAALLSYPRISVWACIPLAIGLALRIAAIAETRRVGLARIGRIGRPAIAIAFVGLLVASPARELLARSVAKPAAFVGPKPPNVLLIVLDTVRADHLSVNGYRRETTPNLDRLASRGVNFTQARSAAPWTLPSHASLLTGRLPHELSAGVNSALDDQWPTLAERLAAKGYDAAGFVANRTYCGAETGLNRGFAYYEDQDLSPRGIMLSTALGKRLIGDLSTKFFRPISSRKTAVEINAGFTSWLSSRGDRPFFAFLNYFDAHDPYVAPKPRRGFGERIQSRKDIDILTRWFILDKSTLGERDFRMVEDAYDDCLHYLDRGVGMLLDDLKNRGILDDTLVIVTSDHGEEFGEHGLYGHASSLYRPEVHVPLIVVKPSTVPAGGTVSEPVSLREAAATIMELVGQGSESPFPGRSLSRFWRSGDVEASSVVSEVAAPVKALPNQGRSPVFRGAMRSILADGHVYIRNDDGTEELFNVEADPGETRNLIGSESHRAILDKLRAELSRARTDSVR